MPDTDKKPRPPIDWTNPPKPGTFMQVTLAPKHASDLGPGLVVHGLLVVRATAGSKKCPALDLRSVLYYLRETALKDAAFRAELERMVSALPPEGAKDASRT